MKPRAMEPPQTWLAVDGGQSAVRALADGMSHPVTAPGVRREEGGVVPSALGAVESCLTQAGRLGGPFDRAVIGLTGLPADSTELTTLKQGLRRLTGARDLIVCGDHVIAHAGALGGQAGIVAAVGTGVVVFAVNDRGESVRVDGCGYLFGDDGSASWIGRHAVRAIMRAQDGRGPATSLTAAAETRFGPWEGTGLIDRLYASRSLNDDVAQFAPDVMDQAQAGDPEAGAIIHETARLLAESINAAARIFRQSATPNGAPPTAPEAPIAACVTGRLVRPSSVLSKALERETKKTSMRIQLRPPLGGALEGAAAIASHHTAMLHPKSRS